MKELCIWCKKTSDEVTFIKTAHTFPKSLGGNSICNNVCDDCNHYFGSPKPQIPSIEVSLKELLNVSRHILLRATGKEKLIGRFKSEYFKLDFDKRKLSIKHRYKIQKQFQNLIARQFTRGIYKVYLEERQNQIGDALRDRFEFIRDFSRHNNGTFHIYIFKPKIGATYFNIYDIKNPIIRFSDLGKELDERFRIFEYTICGHNFAIPTSNLYEELFQKKYENYLYETKHPIGHELIKMQLPSDLDVTFSYMNRKNN